MNELKNPREINLSPSRLDRLIYAADENTGSARQDHGFVFQSGISNLLNLWVPKGYTDKWDAFESDPSTDPAAIPFSFKNIGLKNNIELGSLARQTSINQDFYLCVGFWQGSKLAIKKIFIMKIPFSFWRQLWPKDVNPFLEAQVFSGITNSHKDDEKWKKRRLEKTDAWSKALPVGSPMNWHAKRDHQKQMRIQCSIKKSGFESIFKFTYDHNKTRELEIALD